MKDFTAPSPKLRPKMDKHSSLPWKAEGVRIYQGKTDGTAILIVPQCSGMTITEAEANARLIVESVNNYAALQASHRELVEAIESVISWFDSGTPQVIDMGKLREALRRAQEVL